MIQKIRSIRLTVKANLVFNFRLLNFILIYEVAVYIDCFILIKSNKEIQCQREQTLRVRFSELIKK